MNRHYLILSILLCLALSHTANAQKSADKTPVKDTFDFVPGRDVVFYDDFSGYREKANPSRWTIAVHKKPDSLMQRPVKGYVTSLHDTACYYSKSCGFGNVIGRPNWDASEYASNYSNDHWTVEFDFRFSTAGVNCSRFIGLCFSHELKEIDFDVYFRCDFPTKPELAEMDAGNMTYENYTKGRYSQPIRNNEWHHFSLLLTPQEVNGYIDRHKVISVPGATYYIPGLDVLGGNVAFTNFKLAHTNPNAPATSAPTALLTEKKFVTHAITFDKNKAGIKPESIAFITQLADFLKTNLAIKLEIDGHTDSDGADAANMTLSKNRAEAIKGQLVKMGIAPERLTTKGFGASTPIETNATPEGMAQNRRVEFVKK